MQLAVALSVAAAIVSALLWWRARAARRALAVRLEVAYLRLEELQKAFGRFAPQRVVEDIIARGIETKGEKREVTILFADLKGFTGMSEGLDPEVLVRVLNGYFSRVSKAISEHGGHVAKFIGDGVMALFGALDHNPWQHNDAVHAARAMQAALARYNEELRAEGLPELALGIGIHKGVVVAGVIGSHELMEFTCLGDAVNLAARVEALTREHDAEILVTEAVRDVLDPRFSLRALPPVAVKGKSAPVATFAVEGFDAGEREGRGVS